MGSLRSPSSPLALWLTLASLNPVSRSLTGFLHCPASLPSSHGGQSAWHTSDSARRGTIRVAHSYVAIWPPGGGVNDAEGFFKSYLALPVVMFFWACGYLWKREGWLRLDQVDLDSGRREIDWEAHHKEVEKRRNASLPMRVFYFMF